MLRINLKSLSLSNSKIISYLTYIFFGAYFIIGIKIYKDYGITTDEPFQRTSGYYWYLWIISNFFSDYTNFEFLKINFNKMEWSQGFKNGLFLEYGVIFDLFAVFIEDIFNYSINKTMLFISHRPKALIKCNKIFNMDNKTIS